MKEITRSLIRRRRLLALLTLCGIVMALGIYRHFHQQEALPSSPEFKTALVEAIALTTPYDLFQESVIIQCDRDIWGAMRVQFKRSNPYAVHPEASQDPKDLLATIRFRSDKTAEVYLPHRAHRNLPFLGALKSSVMTRAVCAASQYLLNANRLEGAFEVECTREGKDFEVLISRLPAIPGGYTRIRVSSDFVVLEEIPGA